MTRQKLPIALLYLCILWVLWACDNSSTFISNSNKTQTEAMSKSTVLTITKVKTPWYALRGMVVSKMKATIPQYQAIEGLHQKFYSFTEDRRFFGGIYLWENEQKARKQFDTAWFKQVEEKFNTKGMVAYYTISQVHDIATAAPNTGACWAVLSFSKDSLAIHPQAKGLLKIIEITNQDKEAGFLTLWQDKKAAKKYFQDIKAENTYFDTPILLYIGLSQNLKNKQKKYIF